MGDVPTVGQLVLLLGAVACMVAASGLSIARRRGDGERLRISAKACLYWGILLGVGVLVWHSVRRGSWLPLEDNFEALIWLGLLLALFVAYIQRRHPLRGLDWFLVPIAVILLICAAVFGRQRPHEYVDTAWSWVHRVTAYAGAVAFAVAGAAGAMYLIASRRLRRKQAVPGPGLGSLERLERLTYEAVTLGFPLLTVGLVTGLVAVLSPRGNHALGAAWYRSPKVVLAFGVWVVYALVFHSPINPRFRGRWAAMLSVVGLVLMIGTLVAVQFMPAR